MSPSHAVADLREPTPILDRVPPRTAPVALRPVGYALISVVWLLLLALAVVVAFVALPLALSSQVDGGPLTGLPLFRRSDWVATLVVILVAAAPTLGVISLVLLASTTGMLLTTLTLLVRSLRPRYADERLSLSIRSRDTIGPVTTAVTGASVVFVPIRMTRWTKIVTMVRFFGSMPSVPLFALGAAWGVGDMLTVGWILWPVEGAARVAWTAFSVLAAAAIIALAVRMRHRFPRIMPSELNGTRYDRSWPNRPTPRGGAGSGGRRRPRRPRPGGRRPGPAR